ncbi:hypothetical protein OSB04_023193 [Centaurea solstitialis]|uniref:Uncharacterized protein n=1 Tax=Centaurea solstitialis TaxID=347529 RepID=A0AA38WCN4_9ASTR|nr:hypothetical protein OSB04_023193 [Centaurea solstitialis]
MWDTNTPPPTRLDGGLRRAERRGECRLRRVPTCQSLECQQPAYQLLIYSDSFCSEITPEGRRITKLDPILLNGNNIAILVPGGSPDPE